MNKLLFTIKLQGNRNAEDGGGGEVKGEGGGGVKVKKSEE